MREFDECFGGTQAVFNWVQDFSSGLHWAALSNPSLARERIALCREVLDLSEKTDREVSLIHGFRRGLAESYADLGEYAAVEELYTQWMREEPGWGWGWIGWSDIYHHCAPEDQKNPAKAEQILEAGLAVSDVEDRQDILDRLAILYDETGRGEEAARLHEQIATLKAEQSPRSQWIRDDQEGNRGREAGISSGDKMMAEDEEWRAEPVGEGLWEASQTLRNTSPKVGRNDPCPCGSGKKYKKCCGAK